MKIVVDANVVKGYFQESVLGMDVVGNGEITSSAICVFDHVTSENPCFLDEGGIIAHEWRNLVDREWFDGWYAGLLAAGHAQLIVTSNNKQIENRIFNEGFPKSRDVQYVRVADGITSNGFALESVIVTEDMDFHDPTKKAANSSTRAKILANGNGKICKILRKFNIDVRAICTYC